MIKVEKISKSYVIDGKKINIFKDISFEINKGETVALLGRNGSGKSTLLRILGGVDYPDSGLIKKKCSMSWPVGLVGGFQGSLSGRENATFVSRIYCEGDISRVREKVKFVEEFAEIGAYFDKPFKTYSTGMRARVTFGLSMAFDFDIYLIDEVTGAGDIHFREKSKKALLEKKQNSDFIIVDHNMWGTQFNCNKAFILDKGKLTEYESLKEAIKKYKTLFS